MAPGQLKLILGSPIPCATSHEFASSVGVQLSGRHIRGHTGDPGNELVDTLANLAAAGSASHQVDPFIEQVRSHGWATAFDWSWIPLDQNYPFNWETLTVQLPTRATTEPTSQVLPIATSSIVVPPSRMTTATPQWTLLSCNVLSLLGTRPSGAQREAGLGGVAKQDAFFRQILELQVDFFGLQETRIRTAMRSHRDDFFIFRGDATAHGHFGTMIGVVRDRPYLIRDGQPLFFSENHFSIIVAEPRLLIIRIQTPVLKLLLISAHAPCTSTGPDEMQAWWRAVSTKIPMKYHGFQYSCWHLSNVCHRFTSSS